MNLMRIMRFNNCFSTTCKKLWQRHRYTENIVNTFLKIIDAILNVSQS